LYLLRAILALNLRKLQADIKIHEDQSSPKALYQYHYPRLFEESCRFRSTLHPIKRKWFRGDARGEKGQGEHRRD
jgi:hypothetical protein